MSRVLRGISLGEALREPGRRQPGARMSGFGDLVLPKGVSTSVGQLQQMVNEALRQGAIKGANESMSLVVDGVPSVRLQVALDALLPAWRTKALGELLTLLRARYRPRGAFFEWFQAPGAGRKVAGKRRPAREPGAAPPTFWQQWKLWIIGAGIIAAGGVAYFALGGKSPLGGRTRAAA